MKSLLIGNERLHRSDLARTNPHAIAENGYLKALVMSKSKTKAEKEKEKEKELEPTIEELKKELEAEQKSKAGFWRS